MTHSIAHLMSHDKNIIGILSHGISFCVAKLHTRRMGKGISNSNGEIVDEKVRFLLRAGKVRRASGCSVAAGFFFI